MMKLPIFLVALSASLFCNLLRADSVTSKVDELVKEATSGSIQADFRNPTYQNGILETTQGGIIYSPEIRIQAKHIRYTRKKEKNQETGLEEDIICLFAQGDLLVEFKEHVFAGDSIEYDFITKLGVIEDGKTAIGAWFVGGKKIEISADHTYTIYNGFLTTSEHSPPDWQITFAKTVLASNHNFIASCIRLQVYQSPIVRLPHLKANLQDISHIPVRIYAALGGRHGPRGTVLYELFSWNRWKNFLRLDYFLKRGPGLGLETYYRSQNHKERFESISYVAKDTSLENPHRKTRYRLQGNYSNLFYADKIAVNLSYDKLSDQEMASDYCYSSIDLKYAGLTRLQARWQEDKWIANYLTTVRVNDFQSIKQELPSWQVNGRPFTLGSCGIISDNKFKAAYLDFKFAKEVTHAQDYHSIRLEYFQRFYRRFALGPLNVVPEAAWLSIFYDNVRRGHQHWLTMGLFKLEAKLPIYRNYQAFKHVLVPYVRYHYYTDPTLSPCKHYIFDIEDGWCHLNLLQAGAKQVFYFKNSCADKYATLDLYFNTFLARKNQQAPLQKLYAKSIWQLWPNIRSSIDTAWDFHFGYFDHINIRTDWTLNEDFAIATEFRHRSATAWRKADPMNFMLESCRSTEELLHSPLSDRRDTLLVRFFYRFSPTWSSEFQIRHGWNRKREPAYTEFEYDLIGNIQRAWQLRFSYQHKEDDKHRFAVYLNFGLKPPLQTDAERHIPTFSF